MAVSAWTKHLKTEAEKERYLATLRRAHKLFDHILDLIHQNEASLENQEVSPKSYDNPNWHHRQAHANGYKQCLRDFKKLFTLDHKETNERPVRTQQPEL
jgi:hypothetical protein